MILFCSNVNLSYNSDYYLFLFCFVLKITMMYPVYSLSVGNVSEVMSVVHTHINTWGSLFRLPHSPGAYYSDWLCLGGRVLLGCYKKREQNRDNDESSQVDVCVCLQNHRRHLWRCKPHLYFFPFSLVSCEKDTCFQYVVCDYWMVWF